jgi:hypothetical protein
VKIANRYRTTCHCCGIAVKPHRGLVENTSGKWVGVCRSCDENRQDSREDAGLRHLTDVDAQWENWASGVIAERW